MSKFFKKIALFIFPMLIASYPIDLFISRNLSKANKYPENYTTYNDLYKSNINSEVLIYGSSRATHHIDPNIIKDSLNLNAYNFGVIGHNFWIEYMIHLEYLKHNPSPKYIILSLSSFSLEKRKDLFQLNQFLPYTLWNKNIKKYTSSYLGFSYWDYQIPSIRYYGNYRAKKIALNNVFLKSNSIKPYKIKGYVPLNRKWNNDFDNARSMAKKYIIKFHNPTIALFNKFLFECKKQNIKVVFVYSPEYIDGQNFIANRREMINLYHKIANKFNLDFYDYSNDSISFNKKYFNNSIHLNKEGAELFSKKLTIDLKLSLTKK